MPESFAMERAGVDRAGIAVSGYRPPCGRPGARYALFLHLPSRAEPVAAPAGRHARMTALARSLRALYGGHAAELFAFARRLVGNPDAEDVVHDAFVRLATYGAPERLDNPRAYLFRVTANAASDHGRRSSARAAVEESGLDPSQLASPAAGPEERAEQHSLLIGCLAALDSLPAPCRQVFLLHRIDGIPQAEIAAALGIPLRTVERHVARALACCLEVIR